MRLSLGVFFIVFFLNTSSYGIKEGITLNDLIFDDSKPYHLKILEALPNQAIIQIGPDNAKHTIIEFFDYFCGYCKKMHPELIDLVESRNDVRAVFIQYPMLSESSNIIARFAIAANMQGKGFEFHHELFSLKGSITEEKLREAIINAGLNEIKFKIDLGKDRVDKLIKLSSFIAAGSGAMGTPSVFINDFFYPGYMPKSRIEDLLKE
tara:strand:+ start:125 stop:748 length:624 start_codon:yes stop_codon:yes gene_type:complete